MVLKKKTITISGANGFIGRNFCEYLIKKDFNINALTRKNFDFHDSKIKNLVIDYNLNDDLINIIRKSDVLIHTAENPVYGNNKKTHFKSHMLTKRLIELCLKHNPKVRFLYISSIGAIDRSSNDDCLLPLNEFSKSYPSSRYGYFKKKTEDMLISSNLNYTIIRPSLVLGDQMREDSHFSFFINQIIKKKILFRFKWIGSFSVIHVEDLSKAIDKILFNKKCFNNLYFCSGEVVNFDDFLNKHFQDLKFISLNFLNLLPNKFLKFLPFSLKSLCLPALVASDSKLQKETKWSPSLKFNLYVKDIISRERNRINPYAFGNFNTLITGAASGLGRELAYKLSPIRNKILLIDKNLEDLQIIKKNLKNCEIEQLDLNDDKALYKFLNDKSKSKDKTLEIFACAGIGYRVNLMDDINENFRKTFNVNVVSHISLIQYFYKNMIKQNFGRIVLISSSAAFQPLPYMSAYSASKSSILFLGEALRAEIDSKKINIINVCPGGMDTNFQKSNNVKKNKDEKLLTVDYVIEKIFLGLLKNKMTIIISSRAHIMYFLSKILPRRLAIIFYKFSMKKMR